MRMENRTRRCSRLVNSTNFDCRQTVKLTQDVKLTHNVELTQEFFK